MSVLYVGVLQTLHQLVKKHTVGLRTVTLVDTVTLLLCSYIRTVILLFVFRKPFLLCTCEMLYVNLSMFILLAVRTLTIPGPTLSLNSTSPPDLLSASTS